MKTERYVFIFGSIAVAVMAIVGVFLWVRNNPQPDLETETPPVNARQLGEAGAPITIDTYADFT